MPKASAVGKFRKAAKAAAAIASSVTPADAGGATSSASANAPSRGQKKRMAKRENYLRKERLVMGCLMLKKQEDQAKRIDGLDAMKQALLSTINGDNNDKDGDKKNVIQNTNSLKSQKSRQMLLQRESNQLQLVMQHPAFQADHLATIRGHLTNSLANQAAKRQQEQAEHEKRVREAQKTAVHKPKRKKHRARPTRSKA